MKQPATSVRSVTMISNKAITMYWNTFTCPWCIFKVMFVEQKAKRMETLHYTMKSMEHT